MAPPKKPENPTAGQSANPPASAVVDPETIGAIFSDPGQLDAYFKYLAEVKKYTPEQILELFLSRNLPVILTQLRAQGAGKAQIDAVKALIGNIPEGNKAQWAEILKFFNKHGMMDAETLEKYRDNYMSMQKGIVDDAIEAGKSPYKAMQTLASLGVLVGGIAAMVGKGMDRPEWTAFGQQTIAMSMDFAKIAQKGILDLHNEQDLLKNLAKTPPEFSKDLARLDTRTAERSRINNPLLAELNLNSKQYDYIMGAFRSGGAAPGRLGGKFDALPLGQDAKFDEAYAFVARFEGGFSNNPNDNGGPTLYGIASTKNPQAYTRVKALYDAGKVEDAQALARGFYHDEFWKPMVSPGMSGAEALILFDTAVNLGVGKAQELAAKANGDMNELLRFRKGHYDNLITRDPKQSEFANGWSNRLRVLQSALAREASGTGLAATTPAADLSIAAKGGVQLTLIPIPKDNSGKEMKLEIDFSKASKPLDLSGGSGGGRGFDQSAAELSLDGDAGSFVSGQKPVQYTVPLWRPPSPGGGLAGSTGAP